MNIKLGKKKVIVINVFDKEELEQISKDLSDVELHARCLRDFWENDTYTVNPILRIMFKEGALGEDHIMGTYAAILRAREKLIEKLDLFQYL